MLRDLEASGAADPRAVSLLEDAVVTRRWWAEQWAEGREYVAGLVAQDVQDALFDQIGDRWPMCPVCGDEDVAWMAAQHQLYIHPELGGPDPSWVCEESGVTVAQLGRLSHRSGLSGPGR